MRPKRGTAILAAALAVIAGASASAWGFGGGTAPGGPLSGSIRPACNGYNMDGTVDTAPGGDRAGCVDHSAASQGQTGRAQRREPPR